MTVIVGCVENGIVYMGADSAVARGWTGKSLRKDPKIVRVGDLMIGTSGPSRIQGLLKHSLILPARVEGVSDEAYMVRDVVNAIRYLMKDAEAPFEDANLLAAYHGRLFRISQDYGALEQAEIAAAGTGEDYAVGAMLALRDLLPVRERMVRAMEIAGECANGIAPPYYIETLE